MQESSQAIRSYVRREHRMTPGQARALKDWWPEYGLSSKSGWFDYPGECILEIGFGMGQSLAAGAEQSPEKNFIGIEVHRPGVGALLLMAVKHQLKNIHIYNEDALIVLKNCIKDNSLSEIQIFFPDPWPKNRHRKRRLIQPEFIKLLQQKLKTGGRLHLATDWPDYAEQMLTIVENTTGFSNCAGKGCFSTRNSRLITKFEQRSLDLGKPIWDLVFISHPLAYQF